jgi:tetratricopeptide (TPR) repeat protein
MSGPRPRAGGDGGDDGDLTATMLQANADYLPGTILAGRFRIEGMLGIGGMGVVYRATDLALDVPVALKLLRPELAHRKDAFERFRQELLLARQVSSPRVVRIHDLARHEDRWLIGMDLIEGESLDRRLDLRGALPIDDALRIARQVAEGLAAAHARGVVHRDLKPANILIDQQGDACIADFGVARSLAGSGGTRTGTVVGTPDYVSPEQARGDAADARSDLYSLGLILYEMLAGKLPFAGGTTTEVLAQRMLRSPPPLTDEREDVPAWVARLVDRMLRPQPAHRFQSADEVVAAIEDREVPRRLYADVLRPHLGAWLSLAAVLVLGVGALGWWHWHSGPVVPPPSPPLDRLLVLPIAGDSLDPATATTLGTHLRDALAAVPGYAVVGRARSLQALRQLDTGGNTEPALESLQRVAAASRVLRLWLLHSKQGWRVRALLLVPGQATRVLEGSPAPAPVAALQSWVQSSEAAAALGLEPGAVTLALPDAQGLLREYGEGLLARDRGQLADALAHFSAATAAAPGYVPAWLATAGVATMIGEDDKAADAIEQGQRVRGAPSPLAGRLAAQRALLEGDAPAAVAQFRALLAATPDDTDAELGLARARGAGGDFPAAVAALRLLSRRDGNDPRVWFELGKFSILSGDAQRAVDDYLVRALVLSKRSRDLFGEAEAVNALGIGYGRLGQSEDAAEQYRKAVGLRRTIGNVRGEATSLRNLANALSLTGDFDSAARELERARSLHARLDDREGLAAVESEIGLLAEERGLYPDALQAFRRALGEWQDLDDPLGVAQARNDIGFAQYQLGHYADAQVYLQQAAADYATIGDAIGTVRSSQDLGLLAIASGHWNEARQRLQQSLAAAGRQQMQEEAAVSRRHLADLELQQGHLAASIAESDKALASFRQREDPRGASDAGLLKVDALLAAHADKAAEAMLDSLTPSLHRTSREQRAIALVLRAELAARHGDDAGTRRALSSARTLAASSGIRLLQLRIALAEARLLGKPAPTLGTDTAALGNAGLRLQWLQLAMQQALARGDAAHALDLYRDALPLLRDGDWLHAGTLHALGARASELQGDADGAAAARLRALAADAALRSSVPPGLLAGFDAAAGKAVAAR